MVEAIGERIFIRHVERADTLRPDSIIIIPDAYKRRPCIGQVVAVGEPDPGVVKYDYPWELELLLPTPALCDIIKPGDYVLYDELAGKTYEVNGVELRTVVRHDVFAIVEPTAAMQYLNGGSDNGWVRQLTDNLKTNGAKK